MVLRFRGFTIENGQVTRSDLSRGEGTARKQKLPKRMRLFPTIRTSRVDVSTVSKK